MASQRITEGFMMLATLTREGWLELAIDKLRPHFAAQGAVIPDNVRVTVGFTSRGGKKAIGQVWSDTCSDGGVYEIFIHPELIQLRALDVLVHELVHVCVGIEKKHGKAFKTLATVVGLTGKMTATIATPELITVLERLDLPKYPHFKLNTHGTSSGPKKQTTRTHKAQCPCCEYHVRITRKWIDAVGLPDCPACKAQLVVQYSDE
jgi:hypothetical protein